MMYVINDWTYVCSGIRIVWFSSQKDISWMSNSSSPNMSLLGAKLPIAKTHKLCQGVNVHDSSLEKKKTAAEILLRCRKKG